MSIISVTQQHLDEGIPGDACACPVVLAIIDAFPDSQLVSVGDWYISMYDQGQSRLLLIPEDVCALITTIDCQKQPVEPFTFELDYPAVTR